jgi:hypothetical protein
MSKVMVGLCILILFVGLGVTTRLDGRQDIQRTGTAARAAGLPAETQALVGTWERVPGEDPRLRVVVQAIHPGWASVRLVWGKVASDGIERWVDSRAKVLPGGRFHISSPFRMTFSLSEDHDALLGTHSSLVPSDLLVLTRTADSTRLAGALPVPEMR